MLKLTKRQINRISEILAELGVGVAIATVLPSMLIKLDPFGLTVGSTFSILFLVLSIKILKL